MKKRLLAAVMTAIIALSVAGCTSGDKKSEGGQASKKPVVIQIGYELNPGEPVDLACQEWKKLIEERSNGTMKVELFPSSQLGNKNDLLDQMTAGDAVITIASSATYAERGVTDMGITFGPYMFETWEECEKLTSSDWWQEQCSKLEENGLKIISSNWQFGTRHTMTTKPIRTVEDFKGMKLRVPNNNIQVKGMEVLGVAAVPMPLGEVYTALQQGTIDGLENPISTLYNGKFHEVAKYLILDGHIKDFTTWVCGNEFFNSLTEDQQKILTETADEAGLFNNDIIQEAEDEALEKMKAEGVEIIELNFDELRDATKSFYTLKDFTSIWSEGLYEEVKSIIE